MSGAGEGAHGRPAPTDTVTLFRRRMLFHKRRLVSPIGIDIGFQAVRMLQLECAPGGGGAGYRVVAAVRRPLPAEAVTPEALAAPGRRGALIAAVIRDALRGGGFVGRRAVAALPREIVHLKNLRLPPVPDSDLAWAVRADARDIFGFDPDSARVQFLDAGEVRQGG